MQSDFVWAPVDGYTLCRVVSSDEKTITVEIENKGEQNFPTRDVLVHTGEDTSHIEDLIKIDSLNEAVILNSLIKRYQEEHIYVCIQFRFFPKFYFPILI
jgi:myosin heavy subunit